MNPPCILSRESDGATIAYHRTEGRGSDAEPGIVFLPGFRSDMDGGKALAVEAWCRSVGRACLRFDYTGHGRSSGDFEDGTIGQWAADAVYAIDRLTEEPVVLVGSSMGGWIMMLVARALPDRVAGLVGIAPAPDFTAGMMADPPPGMLEALARDGVWREPSAYSDEPTPFTRALFDDGRKQLVLTSPFPFDGPVRIIQGMRDPDVRWQHALKVADAIGSDDIEICLVKNGDHRLSAPTDLARLTRTLAEICRRTQAA